MEIGNSNILCPEKFESETSSGNIYHHIFEKYN